MDCPIVNRTAKRSSRLFWGRIPHAVYLCAFATLVSGCFSSRIDAYAYVKNQGQDEISTKYRYHLEAVNKIKKGLAGALTDDSSADFHRKVDLCAALKKYQPNVFADKGIPLVVNEISRVSDVKKRYWLTQNLATQTGFIIPTRYYRLCKMTYEIKLAKRDRAVGSVSMGWCGKWGVSLIIPSSWILDDSPEDCSGAGYCVSETVYNQSDVDYGMLRNAPYWNVDKALAYAVASKLKEMEDSGEINALFSEIEMLKPSNSDLPIKSEQLQ